jgi:hypothetical protein
MTAPIAIRTRIRIEVLTLSILLTALGLFAPLASAQVLDVVFDLDWTLIYNTTPELAKAEPKDTFKIDGHDYRFADHALEVLDLLRATPGIRLSYFSGGDAARNREVIKEIKRRVPVKFYRSLDTHHLHSVSDDTSLRFRERFKKDLAGKFDLARVVLVDDVREFAFKGQEDLVLWLGETYEDWPRYELRSIDTRPAQYFAPDFKAWAREREKLVRALGLILQARALWRAPETFGSVLQRVLMLELTGVFDPFKRGRAALATYTCSQALK